jgi:hypothetical protein
MDKNKAKTPNVSESFQVIERQLTIHEKWAIDSEMMNEAYKKELRVATKQKEKE